MGLSNHGELKAAIVAWAMNASGILTDHAADIVTLSQGYLNANLRARQMLDSAVIAIDSGEYPLPADFAVIFRVADASTGADLAESIDFIVLADAIVRIGSSADIELTYYREISPFASDSASDWLLDQFPHIYLCAGQMLAYEFLGDYEQRAELQAVLEGHIAALNGETA